MPTTPAISISPETPRRPASLAMHAPLALIVAGLCLAVAGCGHSDKQTSDDTAGGDPAPAAARDATDCASLGEKLSGFSARAMDGLEGRKHKLMASQLTLVEEKFVRVCRDEDWPIDVRACMAVATDVASFNSCTAPLRKAKGLPPPPASSAPGQRPDTAPPPASGHP